MSVKDIVGLLDSEEHLAFQDAVVLLSQHKMSNSEALRSMLKYRLRVDRMIFERVRHGSRARLSLLRFQLSLLNETSTLNKWIELGAETIIGNMLPQPIPVAMSVVKTWAKDYWETTSADPTPSENTVEEAFLDREMAFEFLRPNSDVVAGGLKATGNTGEAGFDRFTAVAASRR